VDFIGAALLEIFDHALGFPPEKIHVTLLIFSIIVLGDPHPGTLGKAQDVSVREGDLGLGFALGPKDVPLIDRIAQQGLHGRLPGPGDIDVALDLADLAHRCGQHRQRHKHQNRRQQDGYGDGDCSFHGDTS